MAGGVAKEGRKGGREGEGGVSEGRGPKAHACILFFFECQQMHLPANCDTQGASFDLHVVVGSRG